MEYEQFGTLVLKWELLQKYDRYEEIKYLKEYVELDGSKYKFLGPELYKITQNIIPLSEYDVYCVIFSSSLLCFIRTLDAEIKNISDLLSINPVFEDWDQWCYFLILMRKVLSGNSDKEIKKAYMTFILEKYIEKNIIDYYGTDILHGKNVFLLIPKMSQEAYKEIEQIIREMQKPYNIYLVSLNNFIAGYLCRDSNLIPTSARSSSKFNPYKFIFYNIYDQCFISLHKNIQEEKICLEIAYSNEYKDYGNVDYYQKLKSSINEINYNGCVKHSPIFNKNMKIILENYMTILNRDNILQEDIANNIKNINLEKIKCDCTPRCIFPSYTKFIFDIVAHSLCRYITEDKALSIMTDPYNNKIYSEDIVKNFKNKQEIYKSAQIIDAEIEYINFDYYTIVNKDSDMHYLMPNIIQNIPQIDVISYISATAAPTQYFLKLAECIEKKASAFIRYTAHAIVSEEIDTTKLILLGDSGFEEIIDKNHLSNYKIDLANNFIAGYIKNNNTDNNENNISKYLRRRLNSLQSIPYVIRPLLIFIDACIDGDDNLSKYKTKYDDWIIPDNIFGSDKFKISKTDKETYKIHLSYRGLKIKILTVEVLPSNFSEDYFSDYFFNVGSYKYYRDTLSKIKNPNENIKKMIELLNSDDYKDLNKKPIYAEEKKCKNWNMIQKYKGTEYNMWGNSQINLENLTLIYGTIINAMDKKLLEAVRCYTKNGDRLINQRLLEINFNIANADPNQKKKYKDLENKNCHSVEDDEDYIQKMDSIFNSIETKKVLGVTEVNPITLRLIRITRVSLYGKKNIENYEKNEIINIPSYVSTAHTGINWDFSDHFDRLVVLEFFIKMTEKNIKRILFVDNVSDVKGENEVLINHNQKYRIVKKRYETFRFIRRQIIRYVQKLVITLIFEDEDDDIVISDY